jgi:hypothetical protein
MDILPREMIGEIAAQVDYFTMDQWKATSRELADMLQPFHGLDSVIKSFDPQSFGELTKYRYSQRRMSYFIHCAPLVVIERRYRYFAGKYSWSLYDVHFLEALASNAHILTFDMFHEMLQKRYRFGWSSRLQDTTANPVDVAIALISAERDIHFILDMKQHEAYKESAVNLRYHSDESGGWMFPACLERPDWEDVIMKDSIGLFCSIDSQVVSNFHLDGILGEFATYLRRYDADHRATYFRNMCKFYHIAVTYILPHDKDGKRMGAILYPKNESGEYIYISIAFHGPRIAGKQLSHTY